MKVDTAFALPTPSRRGTNRLFLAKTFRTKAYLRNLNLRNMFYYKTKSILIKSDKHIMQMHYTYVHISWVWLIGLLCL